MPVFHWDCEWKDVRHGCVCERAMERHSLPKERNERTVYHYPAKAELAGHDGSNCLTYMAVWVGVFTWVTTVVVSVRNNWRRCSGRGGGCLQGSPIGQHTLNYRGKKKMWIFSAVVRGRVLPCTQTHLPYLYSRMLLFVTLYLQQGVDQCVQTWVSTAAPQQ